MPLFATRGPSSAATARRTPSRIRRRCSKRRASWACRPISASTSATTRDIVAGKAAGMRTVAATYGYLGGRPDVAAWRADASISTPLGLAGPLEGAPRGLKYASWGCTGFDVGSDTQQGMSRFSHLVNPLKKTNCKRRTFRTRRLIAGELRNSRPMGWARVPSGVQAAKIIS
jgi:hypothetical protein